MSLDEQLTSFNTCTKTFQKPIPQYMGKVV